MNPSIKVDFDDGKMVQNWEVKWVNIQVWYQSGKCLNIRVANTGAIRID